MEIRPWLNNYPTGVPVNIDPDKYQNLVEIIDETAEKFKNKPAFECMGKSITFQQCIKNGEAFAAYLHSRGLNPGDRIALMMPNILQYPIALFGALKAGLIIVNTNPLYTPREMLHQFKDSDVRAIVIAENFASNLEQILPETGINTIILASIGEMLGAIKGTMVNFVVRSVKKMVPAFDLPNTVKFSEAVSQGKKFSIRPFESHPNDVIIHQYTGGTTGLSKGAMLTNRNLIANMEQIKAIMTPLLIEGEEIILCPLPLYHIFAFTVNCLALFSFGSKNLLITNPRDISGLVKEMKKHPISLITGVNTLFNALNNHKDFATLDFSHLKITVGGGMAVQQVVANEWKRITGCTLSEAYGMTESSPGASVNPLDGSARMGTIGLPIPSTDMRIVDDNRRELGIDQVGEIQIKGPQVMLGYYNQPEETSKVLIDGWLCTGDIGKMDSDGFFRIVDRKKDMILVSGFNVFPNEIEDEIAKNPKVLEVAAIGIPDEKSGEVVKVFVVKKDKSLSEKELKEYCKKTLTGYKVPKEVQFLDELPKTNVGKILRRKLREL